MSQEILTTPTKGSPLVGFKYDNGELVMFTTDDMEGEGPDKCIKHPIIMTKDQVLAAIVQLIAGYDFKPTDVFDEQWLIGHMSDNYWSEMHGH